jgi:signal transduction histidine kinase
MRPHRRLVDRIARPHLPRRTVRLRLTLVYGTLFLVSGAALLAITYLLVVRATDGVIFHGQDYSVVVGTHNGSHRTTAAPGQTNTQGSPPQNGAAIDPASAERLAKHQHAAELYQLLLQSGIALAIMTVVSIGLGWLVAGHVLRPLRGITTAVRDISETNLHRRLALAGPNDELKELGDTFDGLLTRLEASFQAQRRFVANASHELRTPLARQRTLAQVALADPNPTVESLRAAHERVLAAGTQQQRLIDALLTLARGQAGIDRHDRFDLAELATQVLATRSTEATARGLDLRTTLRPAATAGHPRLVERLIANLIDNALHHNQPDGHIEVQTETRDGHAVLTISNTGPDIPTHAIEQLFQPFRRLTDRIGDGLGLGLSIVAAIADAHHATITTQPRPHGGLTIQISFPNPAHPTRHHTATAAQPETPPAPAPETTTSEQLTHR